MVTEDDSWVPDSMGACGGIHQEKAGSYPRGSQVSSVTAQALWLP